MGVLNWPRPAAPLSPPAAAWAAGWLYKATKQDSYLSDMYDFYTKHLGVEADIADWK